MQRLFFVCLAVASIAVCLSAQPSIAQDPPAVLDYYRLLPRLSTLRQTGGFAGAENRYRLIGEYDFRHGRGRDAMAAFENAEIWGSLISDQPTPAYVLDVDEILNLEGLKGEALPVGGPFDVYRFRGVTSDESTVELFAAVIGPWMYLRGATEPPPGSADFFTYQLRALARSGPFADFNGDGVVDAADYVALRRNGGAAGDESSAGAGFAEWRQQFGERAPDVEAMDAMMSAAMASAATTAAVPEPACLGLAIFACLFFFGCLRRRNGS
jgi:hypothetical protein